MELERNTSSINNKQRHALLKIMEAYPWKLIHVGALKAWFVALLWEQATMLLNQEGPPQETIVWKTEWLKLESTAKVEKIRQECGGPQVSEFSARVLSLLSMDILLDHPEKIAENHQTEAASDESPVNNTLGKLKATLQKSLDELFSSKDDKNIICLLLLDIRRKLDIIVERLPVLEKKKNKSLK